MIRQLRASLALAALLMSAMLPASAMEIEQTLTPVDRPVPEFNLPGVNGEQWNNDGLDGKLWVINFWAVWCPSCIEEIPAFNRLRTLMDEEQVGMLAINVGDSSDGINTFLEENDLTIDFPIVVGDKLKTLGNWSARNLPYTVIVNTTGQIVYEAIGPREWDDPRFVAAILDLSD